MTDLNYSTGSGLPDRSGLIKSGKYSGKWCELTGDDSGGWALVIFTGDLQVTDVPTGKHCATNILLSDYFPSHDAVHYFMRDEIPEIDWK